MNRKFCTSSLKSFNEIPGPLSLPLIGTLYQYLPFIGRYEFDRIHINGMKKLERYGPVVREEIAPGVNIIWLFKPEDIRTLFRFEGKYPERRSHLALQKYRLDKPHIYNNGGLLPTNGPEWYRMRSVFQRGLSSPQAVQKFLPQINEVIDVWFRRIDEINTEKLPNFDYMPEISRLFLELVGLVIFDIKLNSFSKHEYNKNSLPSKLIQAALNTNSCILKTDNGLGLWKKFSTPMYKKLSKSQDFMEDVARNLLRQKLREKNLENNENTILDNYLASPELDLKDVLTMTCDFLLAGIDTTSNTTSFLLYHLAKNRLCQSKLYLESKSILPTTSSFVTAENLNSAPYVKAVVKEVLRLNPISVGTGRILTEDAVFSNYHVPKGTVIVTQNQISCQLEEYFPQAQKFIPERWLKGDKMYQQPHPFLLLPFGHGPRACIARRLAEQNMQALILKLVRNYIIKWDGDDSLGIKTLLINVPDGPIKLKLVKRSEK